jgi:hypothetical protein
MNLSSKYNARSQITKAIYSATKATFNTLMQPQRTLRAVQMKMTTYSANKIYKRGMSKAPK